MEPASPDTLLTAQDVLAMTGYKSRTSLILCPFWKASSSTRR